MRFANKTLEYYANIDAMREMEQYIPMTRSERDLFYAWVHEGQCVESNPWKICEPDGSSMNFLKALRIRQGYSHGPWDSWEYAECILPENPGFFVIRTKKH